MGAPSQKRTKRGVSVEVQEIVPVWPHQVVQALKRDVQKVTQCELFALDSTVVITRTYWTVGAAILQALITLALMSLFVVAGITGIVNPLYSVVMSLIMLVIGCVALSNLFRTEEQLRMRVFIEGHEKTRITASGVTSSSCWARVQSVMDSLKLVSQQAAASQGQGGAPTELGVSPDNAMLTKFEQVYMGVRRSLNDELTPLFQEGLTKKESATLTPQFVRQIEQELYQGEADIRTSQKSVDEIVTLIQSNIMRVWINPGPDERRSKLIPDPALQKIKEIGRAVASAADNRSERGQLMALTSNDFESKRQELETLIDQAKPFNKSAALIYATVFAADLLYASGKSDEKSLGVQSYDFALAKLSELSSGSSEQSQAFIKQARQLPQEQVPDFLKNSGIHFMHEYFKSGGVSIKFESLKAFEALLQFTDGKENPFAENGPARSDLLNLLKYDTTGEGGDLLRAANCLATMAHAGQTDKAGRPYREHPARVAMLVHEAGGAPEVEAAAWLHDTLEDTWVTPDFIQEAGFSAAVVHAVKAVTKRAGESAEAYAARIAADPLAVQVKRADLDDNMDPTRLDLLDEATRSRLQAKYARFTALLDEAVTRRAQQPLG